MKADRVLLHVVLGVALCAAAAFALSLDSPPKGPLARAEASETVADTGDAGGMPPALRMAWIAQVQQDAPASYALSRVGDDRFRASHAERELSATFSPQGAAIELADRPESFGLRLARYGYDGAMSVAIASAPEATRNRVEYARGTGLSEWYVHGPLGIEHGFTVVDRPAGTRADELVLEMDVEGATPRLIDEQSAVLAMRTDGTKVHYRDLYAVDATGKLLPARMTVDGTLLAIRVRDRAAIYPLSIDPLIWVEEAKLVAGDPASGANFGNAVAISGDSAVVGALNDVSTAGSAYVFVRSGSVWTQEQKLVASDGQPGDSFGASVAIAGDTICVGAPSDDHAAINAGSAYVFVRGAAVWTEQQKITESVPAQNALLGLAVAISGETIAVGRIDAALVFVRSGTTWTEEQRIVPSDLVSNDRFGHSIALSIDTLIVGAPQAAPFGANSGTAYIFQRTGTTWVEQQKLAASDTAPSDRFGWSVAISGDTSVVGAPIHGADAQSGAAYVFVNSAGTWTEEQKLSGADPDASTKFGESVGIDADTIIVGAPLTSELFKSSFGVAYIMLRVGTVWTTEQTLRASDDQEGDQFGISVALSGGRAVVGAFEDDDGGSNSGSAYIFAALEDTDDDGIVDDDDNCPLISNPSQADLDGDGIGDPCDNDDNDLDDDGIADDNDNCPNDANADQSDIDSDGLGDICDPDDDGDGVGDVSDNCPSDTNSDQSDIDGDNAGDVCDADIDGDGVANAADNCPLVANGDQADVDSDGEGDVCDGDADGDSLVDIDDNCPLIPNLNQADLDSDGIGDVCDLDDDDDGVDDSVDNCARNANADQSDNDGDDQGDVCDDDDDNDGIPDASDNCPLSSNAAQPDLDMDGLGDDCDGDADDDGVVDPSDNCPRVVNGDQTDTDGDMLGDACDDDDDNDGIPDTSDNCQIVVNPGQGDVDGDGDGDVCDGDQDGDGEIDQQDNCPVNANQAQEDVDGDGIGDACDDDNDNDGILDTTDNCRLKANGGQEDIDGNGIGDACDSAGEVETFYGCAVTDGQSGSNGPPGWWIVGVAMWIARGRRRRSSFLWRSRA